jgi:hypothetical protein
LLIDTSSLNYKCCSLKSLFNYLYIEKSISYFSSYVIESVTRKIALLDYQFFHSEDSFEVYYIESQFRKIVNINKKKRHTNAKSNVFLCIRQKQQSFVQNIPPMSLKHSSKLNLTNK